MTAWVNRAPTGEVIDYIGTGESFTAATAAEQAAKLQVKDEAGEMAVLEVRSFHKSEVIVTSTKA
jgi:hypothetical protein